METQRLQLIIERDGIIAAKEFARRTYKLYGAALKTPYGKEYRKTLILSRLCFRCFLKNNGCKPF